MSLTVPLHLCYISIPITLAQEDLCVHATVLKHINMPTLVTINQTTTGPEMSSVFNENLALEAVLRKREFFTTISFSGQVIRLSTTVAILGVRLEPHLTRIK